MTGASLVILAVDPMVRSYRREAYSDATAPTAVRSDIFTHHLQLHMAPAMYDQLSVSPQASGGENFRQKASFRVLPDGKHEHHLINLRTEVTASDTLRNFIKAIWQKQQDQNAQKVGRVAGLSMKAS